VVNFTTEENEQIDKLDCIVTIRVHVISMAANPGDCPGLQEVNRTYYAIFKTIGKREFS
jgi:hypothetical protein